jgi:hypothetical protein
MLASIRQAAAYRPDVRLVLEYQPHDMRARPLLSNVGRMLHICAQVPLANLGANLDVGHSIAAGEAPAEAAALLASVDRLYYMHSNDNTGDGGDWDMISASVHLWEWLELLVVLERLQYSGWIGADIKAHLMDAPAVFGANTRMLLPWRRCWSAWTWPNCGTWFTRKATRPPSWTGSRPGCLGCNHARPPIEPAFVLLWSAGL